MFRYLRVRGKLPAGCIITVEPGIYFCRFIIEPFLEDPKHKDFIDKSVLDKYWEVGGVRIEGETFERFEVHELNVAPIDDVLVTKDGHDNLTLTPKAVEELESLMA